MLTLDLKKKKKLNSAIAVSHLYQTPIQMDPQYRLETGNRNVQYKQDSIHRKSVRSGQTKVSTNWQAKKSKSVVLHRNTQEKEEDC